MQTFVCSWKLVKVEFTTLKQVTCYSPWFSRNKLNITGGHIPPPKYSDTFHPPLGVHYDVAYFYGLLLKRKLRLDLGCALKVGAIGE